MGVIGLINYFFQGNMLKRVQGECWHLIISTGKVKMVVQDSFSGLKTSSHDDYKFSIVSSPQGCFIMAP